MFYSKDLLKKKEETIMMTREQEINNKLNEFLIQNKDFIDKVTLHNPVIKKDDEWARETTWDEDYKECDAR